MVAVLIIQLVQEELALEGELKFSFFNGTVNTNNKAKIGLEILLLMAESQLDRTLKFYSNNNILSDTDFELETLVKDIHLEQSSLGKNIVLNI